MIAEVWPWVVLKTTLYSWLGRERCMCVCGWRRKGGGSAALWVDPNMFLINQLWNQLARDQRNQPTEQTIKRKVAEEKNWTTLTKMPKTAKKSYAAKRSSPFEMFLEKLIIYELTKPDKDAGPSTTLAAASSSSSSSSSDESGSISSGSSSCDTESETGRATPKTPTETTMGRPSVIVENVNYVVDIIWFLKRLSREYHTLSMEIQMVVRTEQYNVTNQM